MNSNDTLSTTLCSTPDSEAASLHALLPALRRRCVMRRTLRGAAAGCALLAAGAAIFLTWSVPPPATNVRAELPADRYLTEDQLLASLGTQPVALVKWPDGRQELLTVMSPPATPRLARR